MGSWADAICITTNGERNSRGDAIMGAGVAKQALQRFPGVASLFAAMLRRNGHITQIIGEWAPFSPASSKSGTVLVSFPTKHEWRLKADIDLIAMSAVQLMALIEQERWQRVVLPKPGCANGGLDWDTQVRPVLEDLLDERVVVVDFA